MSDQGDYEAVGYILTETEFATWTDHDDPGKTWLLMKQETADRLCPSAAEDRQHCQSSVERDAESAAHADNLIRLRALAAAGSVCAATYQPSPAA